MSSVNRHSRIMGLICLGVMLAAAGRVSVAAERVVGKVTAFNYAQDTIDINGMTFNLTSSSKRELLGHSNTIKPGQAVVFETEGKQVVRIQPIKDGADFPLLTPPGSGVRSVPSTR